jgi:hypothetical protein
MQAFAVMADSMRIIADCCQVKGADQRIGFDLFPDVWSQNNHSLPEKTLLNFFLLFHSICYRYSKCNYILVLLSIIVVGLYISMCETCVTKVFDCIVLMVDGIIVHHYDGFIHFLNVP